MFTDDLTIEEFNNEFGIIKNFIISHYEILIRR